MFAVLIVVVFLDMITKYFFILRAGKMKIFATVFSALLFGSEAAGNLRGADNSAGVRLVGGSGGLPPAWISDDSIEAPAGTKDMGGWTAAVYTPEQQKRLGVDESGKKTSDSTSDTQGLIGGSGGLGPAWTTGEGLEAPAGTKDMGGWTAAVYTPEQQKRLGVDEFGTKPSDGDATGPSDMNGVIGMLGGNTLGGNGAVGAIGPAWTYDPTVEKPKGTKDMGGWKEAVYTKEQQERLGVDEHGKPVDKAVVVTAE